MKLNYLLAGAVSLSLISACASQEPGVYRNGELAVPEPFGLRQEPISFRFVDKWRISHQWFTGLVEIRSCKDQGNTFLDVSGFDTLKSETGTPIVERDGRLYFIYSYKGALFLSGYNELFYGTPNRKGRENDFQGFTPVCGHVFQNSLDGIGIYLVKPDPAKGTDEWIRGAEPVTINGLHWLRRIDPIRDWWPKRKETKREIAPIETWVLQIPNTAYWLRLVLSSSTGETSPYKHGSFHYPEEHKKIVKLFHELVESVTLEPITPIDIPAQIEESK